MWIDTNENGFLDEGEQDISGVRLDLVAAGPDSEFGTEDDVVYPADYTASPYLFDPVIIGPARVTVDVATLPPRLAATFDQDGGLDSSAVVFVTTGGIAVANFGFVPVNGAPDLAPGFDTTLQAPLGGAPGPLPMVDPDGDATTVVLVSGPLPAGLSLNADGTFSGAAAETGTFPVVVEICDDFTPQACTTRTLTIVVDEAPDPGPGPVPDPIPDILPLPDAIPETLPLPEGSTGSQPGTSPVDPVDVPDTLPLTGGYLVRLLLAGMGLVALGVGAVRGTGKD